MIKNPLRKLFRQTLLDNYEVPKTSQKPPDFYYHNDYFDYENSDYSYLGGDFDSQIDNAEDAGVAVGDNEKDSVQTENEKTLLNDFQKVVTQAGTKSSVYLINPQKLANPLFLKNQKALILSNNNISKLNKIRLENLISDLLSNRLTGQSSETNFEWTTKTNKKFIWREIWTPFVDWTFYYALQNNKIIFANDEKFLLQILENKNKDIKQEEEEEEKINELKVINLKKRKSVFDRVISELIDKDSTAEKDFFISNIGGLLGVISDVQSIEIKRTDTGVFSSEKISYNLKDSESQ